MGYNGKLVVGCPYHVIVVSIEFQVVVAVASPLCLHVFGESLA